MAKRYQRDNHNPYIKEGQTTHGQNKKEKRTNNDLQNTIQKAKDRLIRTLSQMTTDMFHLSSALPGPFLIHDLSPNL
jgi:hypothetical protein